MQADEVYAGSGNARNGCRDRKLVTTVGTLSLRIPKLRMGCYFPKDVLERYSRTGKEIVAAASEMYAICSVFDEEVYQHLRHYKNASQGECSNTFAVDK